MFKPATRKRVKFKMALTGPSGAGKTYSALLIAKGLVGPDGKIAVIDTENRSASLYAGKDELPPFAVLDLSAPFTTDRYLQALKAAVDAKFDVLIIDSITHQWAGEGGILDRKEKEQQAKPTLNSYTLWAKYTPEHARFVNAINQSDIHVIACIRSKQDYVLEQNDKGKQTPRKVGMAPQQRDGLEYEYSLVLDLSLEHVASISKDRTGLFDGQNFKPSPEVGQTIATWLASGAEPDPIPPPAQRQANTPGASAASNGAGRGQPQGTAGKPQNRAPGGANTTGVFCTQQDLTILQSIAAASRWSADQTTEAMRRIFGADMLSQVKKAELPKLTEYIVSFAGRGAEGIDNLRAQSDEARAQAETEAAAPPAEGSFEAAPAG